MQKEKGQSHPSKSQDLGEGERAKVGNSQTFARKRKVRARVRGRKSELHNEGSWVLGRERRASRESFPGRRKKKARAYERTQSLCSLQENLESLGFTLKVTKPEMGKL